jgi:phthiocerol/phenolphthiocerol synthesis type-I polyketide synthase D
VIGIRELGWDQPARRLASVEAYAAHYAHELVRRQPAGPLRLGGYSLGGLIAYEMAQQLTAAGRPVELVVLLDASPVTAAVAGLGEPAVAEPASAKLRRRYARDGIGGVARAAGRVAERKVVHRITEPAAAARDTLHVSVARHRGRPIDPLVLGRESERAGLELRARYRPAPYAGRVVYVRALGTDPDFPIPDHAHRWRRLVDHLEIVDVPGNHAHQDSMMHPPHAAVVGRRLTELLDRQGRRP